MSNSNDLNTNRNEYQIQRRLDALPRINLEETYQKLIATSMNKIKSISKRTIYLG